MEKINFENLPSNNTPINATNLNQMQTNIEEAIELQITTGEECATNEYIDGKQVYRKRINCGNLLTTGIKRIVHNTEFSEIIKAEGMCTDGTYYQPIPYVSLAGMGEISTYSIGLNVDKTQIYLVVGRDMSSFTSHVDLYYTK